MFLHCTQPPLCSETHTHPTREISSIASNDVLWYFREHTDRYHYNDVIMGTMASQISSLTIVCSTVYSDADQRKHQSSALLAFVRGINRGPVISPQQWPVTRKMFPFDDVIMNWLWNTPRVTRGYRLFNMLCQHFVKHCCTIMDLSVYEYIIIDIPVNWWAILLAFLQ